LISISFCVEAGILWQDKQASQFTCSQISGYA